MKKVDTYMLFKNTDPACQQELVKISQMLTYFLFKTQMMLLSVTGRKGQPDDHLHSV